MQPGKFKILLLIILLFAVMIAVTWVFTLIK